MRLALPLLLALPAICLAQDQFPLVEKIKGWLNKATSSIQSSIPSVAPDPTDAAVSKVAEQVVHNINLSNWKDVLKPNPSALGGPPDEWFVYFDGGNKTCHGLCMNATKAWNTSVALLAASPHPPNLAKADCDEDQILCGMWSIGPPALYHFLIPNARADKPQPATIARYIPLNRSSVTALEIAELHTKEKYKETEPYEGALHPFDGWLEKTGINLPLAYFMWGVSKVPAWLPMILISFLTRNLMSRRTPTQQGQQAGAPPPGQ